MHRLNMQNSTFKGHHMTKRVYKIMSMVLCVIFFAKNVDVDPSSVH